MTTFLITCEHALNAIPPEYTHILNIPENVLSSHRGYDEGALQISKFLSTSLDCMSISGDYSRLLVDLNRSKTSKNLFSEYSGKLSSGQKENILQNYYIPYRKKVEEFVRGKTQHHIQVIHFSIHSFTPVLNGKIRNADIGILYDPGRPLDKNISSEIKNGLESLSKYLKIRKNYPYRGITDGMATYLRKIFLPHFYSGIELEFNQDIFSKRKLLDEVKTHLPDIIRKVTAQNEAKSAVQER